MLKATARAPPVERGYMLMVMSSYRAFFKALSSAANSCGMCMICKAGEVAERDASVGTHGRALGTALCSLQILGVGHWQSALCSFCTSWVCGRAGCIDHLYIQRRLIV